jgi:hypothetical protein
MRLQRPNHCFGSIRRPGSCRWRPRASPSRSQTQFHSFVLCLLVPPPVFPALPFHSLCCRHLIVVSHLSLRSAHRRNSAPADFASVLQPFSLSIRRPEAIYTRAPPALDIKSLHSLHSLWASLRSSKLVRCAFRTSIVHAIRRQLLSSPMLTARRT